MGYYLANFDGNAFFDPHMTAPGSRQNTYEERRSMLATGYG